MNSVAITLGSEQYTKIKYPAGELQVRLTADTSARLSQTERMVILARITSAEQLIELCLLWDAATQMTSPEASHVLVLPYLPFSRADRRFVEGDCFGLKVFSNLLSTLQAEIVTLDAHSKVSGDLINRLTDVSAIPFIEEAVDHFSIANDTDRITILFPDEGARKRYQLADSIKGKSIRILHCSKKRDPKTGKFVGFVVPDCDAFRNGENSPEPVLMVDDICDGGGTFKGIADALKSYGLTMGLYVTHGIFSKGLSELDSRFSSIYTTDSFSARQSEGNLHVISATSLLMDESISKKASNLAVDTICSLRER